MRKYKIEYWAEYEDECTDFSKIIEAVTIKEALEKFYNLRILYKRIFKIKEITT